MGASKDRMPASGPKHDKPAARTWPETHSHRAAAVSSLCRRRVLAR